MSIDIPVESKQHLTLGYTSPGRKTPLYASLKPGLNVVPSDVIEKLRANKGEDGKSMLDRYEDAQILRVNDGRRARAIADGEISPMIAEIPPIQAAAQTLAQTGNEDQAIAAAETAERNIREPPAPRRSPRS